MRGVQTGGNASPKGPRDTETHPRHAPLVTRGRRRSVQHNAFHKSEGLYRIDGGVAVVPRYDACHSAHCARACVTRMLALIMTRCPALQLRRSRGENRNSRSSVKTWCAFQPRGHTHGLTRTLSAPFWRKHTLLRGCFHNASTHAMHMKRRACRRGSGRSDHTGTPLTQTKFAGVERPIADHTPPDPGGDLRSMKDQGSASRNRHNTSRCPCMRMNRSKPRTAVIRGHRLLPSILRFWLIPTRYGATRHKGSRAHRESAAAHLR